MKTDEFTALGGEPFRVTQECVFVRFQYTARVHLCEWQLIPTWYGSWEKGGSFYVEWLCLRLGRTSKMKWVKR